MKRVLCILLTMGMLCSLAACGGKADKPAEDTAATTATTAEEVTTTTATTTATDATDITTVDTTTGTKAPTTTTKPVTTTTADEDDGWHGWGDWEEPTTTTTQPKPDNRPKLKILAIGHSFTKDAMETYMWDLFDAAGYNVTLGYLFYASCSIEQHYHYIPENQGVYIYFKNENGKWDSEGCMTGLDALWDEDWDIVTFQPDPDFGYDTFANNIPCKCEWGCNKTLTGDYVHFDALVTYVLDTLKDKNNPNGSNTHVKVYYHLTWAYSQDSWLGNYLYPGKYDQRTLYQDFVTATKKHILPNKTVLGVIPCGTAIQNARTSFMGDTFNASPGKQDGYHLNDKGDFVAALTWVSYFTGIKATDIKYEYGYVGEEFDAIAEAVDNAIATWDSVTESSYKTQP